MEIGPWARVRRIKVRRAVLRYFAGSAVLGFSSQGGRVGEPGVSVVLVEVVGVGVSGSSRRDEYSDSSRTACLSVGIVSGMVSGSIPVAVSVMVAHFMRCESWDRTRCRDSWVDVGLESVVVLPVSAVILVVILPVCLGVCLCLCMPLPARPRVRAFKSTVSLLRRRWRLSWRDIFVFVFCLTEMGVFLSLCLSSF